MDGYGKRKMDGMGRLGAEEKMLVEFPPPAGLELEGDKGTAMVNWKMTPEGNLRITAIEGVTMDDGEEKVEEVEEDSAAPERGMMDA